MLRPQPQRAYRHGLCSCGAGRTRHEGRNRSAGQASCGNRHSNAIRTAPLSSSRSPKMSRYFTDEHEWIDVEGDIATVGITDYAQGQLGDIVFVEDRKSTRLNSSH